MPLVPSFFRTSPTSSAAQNRDWLNEFQGQAESLVNLVLNKWPNKNTDQGLHQADLTGGPSVFVFGAEDLGVPLEVAQTCDQFISIPTVGKGAGKKKHTKVGKDWVELNRL